MDLKWRLLIPIVSVLTMACLFGLALLIIARSMLLQAQSEQLNQTHSKMIRMHMDDKQAQYESLIHMLNDRAMEQAAFFSQMPEVLSAYRLACQGDPTDENDPKTRQARAQIKSLFQSYQDRWDSRTELTLPYIHFHLPPARSLARTWRKGWQTIRNNDKVDISDDLSEFRQTILKVNSEGKPIQGIEVGRDGFVIRSLYPIFDDNKQVGSVEVFYECTPLLKLLQDDNSEQYAVFMDVKLLKTAEQLRNPDQYPKLGSNYVICAATDINSAGSVTQNQLDQCQDKRLIFGQGHQAIALIPINDFANKKSAYWP